MSQIPSWFNPEEYSNFITESLSLFEFNAPYWKKRRELLADKRNRERAQAIRDGRERAQDAYDLAQAKAEGIMRGMGESFKSELQDKFLHLIEEKNALEQTKSETRQETDPRRKERDRKREERRKEKQSPLTSIVIVRHKKTGRIEIIMKSDYSEKSHEVLKGKVKNIDKGPISKSDLLKAADSAEFMNTKTSMKLLGKIEKGEKKADGGVNDAEQTPESGGLEGEGNQSGQMAPPPPPMPRAPQDGKEITDPASTYPDWDHDSGALATAIAYGINPGQQMPPEISQMLSVSRTLGDSVNRAINELLSVSPGLSEMSFQVLPPVINTGGNWTKAFGIAQSSPNAVVIGSGPEQQLGIAIKIGEQIRPGVKGEADAVLTSLLSSQEGEAVNGTFALMLEDFLSKLREVLLSTLPELDREQKYHTGANAQRYKERRAREKYLKNKNIFKNRAKNLIEDFINQELDLKSSFILESITGNLKFEKGLGSAQMLISVNKDGTDAKLIPLDEPFAFAVANSDDTHLSLKFTDLPVEEGNFMETLFQKMSTLTEAPIDVVVELQKIKDQISNPLVFLQVFNLKLTDAVYSIPVDYSDFYDGDSDTDNIITLNPDSAEEEEIRIPVKKAFTPNGTEENRIELGMDQIFEEYLLLNDYLTGMIISENITKDQALQILSEEFNVLTEEKKKRNYRKEYDEYHGTAEQRANRSKRVLARRKMMKKGKVRKGDGKDVDHKNGNPQDNSDGNLRVLSKSKNRSIKEDHGAGFEGTPELVQKLIKDTPFSQDTPVLFGSRPYSEKKLKAKKK